MCDILWFPIFKLLNDLADSGKITPDLILKLSDKKFTQKTFGIPYFYPFAPFDEEGIKNFFIPSSSLNNKKRSIYKYCSCISNNIVFNFYSFRFMFPMQVISSYCSIRNIINNKGFQSF